MKNTTRATRTAPETRGELNMDEIAAKVADAVCAELRVLLPICARIAAADTIHTVEKAETTFAHAVREGIVAAKAVELARNAQK